MRLELKTVDPLRTPLTSMATLDVSVGALFGIGMAVTTGNCWLKLVGTATADWKLPMRLTGGTSRGSLMTTLGEGASATGLNDRG